MVTLLAAEKSQSHPLGFVFQHLLNFTPISAYPAVLEKNNKNTK